MEVLQTLLWQIVFLFTGLTVVLAIVLLGFDLAVDLVCRVVRDLWQMFFASGVSEAARRAAGGRRR